MWQYNKPMLIHSASQLLTLSGGPQRGKSLGNLHILADGAVLVRDGIILETGRTPEMLAAHPQEERLDAGGCVVMPGFVDPHTHVVWAGDRAAEFEMKMAGAKYLDILAAGGGILSTVRKTREAPVEQLLAETRPRLQRMFAHGTTTAEVKTGYGLDTETEIKLLQTILALDAEGPLELVPTFLGAHAIAPEYRDDPQGYTDLLCREMLPTVQAWWTAQPALAARPLPFVDVFCENKAFTLAQSRQILTRARELGFPAQNPRRRIRQPGRRFAGSRTGGCLRRSPGENFLRGYLLPSGVRIPRRSRCPAPPSGWQRRNTPPPRQSWTRTASWRLPATATRAPPGTSRCSSSSPSPAAPSS